MYAGYLLGIRHLASGSLVGRGEGILHVMLSQVLVCFFSTNGFIVVYVHPDGGLCATDGLFGHIDTPV